MAKFLSALILVVFQVALVGCGVDSGDTGQVDSGDTGQTADTFNADSLPTACVDVIPPDEFEPLLAEADSGPVGVIIFAGQSNASGSHPGEMEIPDHVEIVNVGPDAIGQWGPEIGIARSLPPDRRWLIIKYARGGSVINQHFDAPYWLGDGGHFGSMVAAVRGVLNGLDAYELIAFLWMQGESEAMNMLGARYKVDLTQFIDAVRFEFGQVPFVFTTVSCVAEDVYAVRNAQFQVYQTVPDTHLINADYTPKAPDGIHLAEEGSLCVGEFLGELIAIAVWA